MAAPEANPGMTPGPWEKITKPTAKTTSKIKDIMACFQIDIAPFSKTDLSLKRAIASIWSQWTD
ncbi:hypothetical protein [Hoeflea sp.]|uniref:hypothetical protein n=1 Tax=Hoeflea sp. TaxID=1940281 RepID=UPI003B015FEC